MTRVFAVLLIVVASGYLGLLLLAFFSQERMLFFPSLENFDDCAPTVRSGTIRPVRARHGDIELRYHLHEKPGAKAWLIVFHGNGGSACDRAFYTDLLEELPLRTVLVEYPGYAGDSGELSEENFLRYALALQEHIETLNSKTGNQPIILLGESLGAGITTYIAANKPVAGMILISPYTAIEDIAVGVFPWLPVRLVLKHKFRADAWAKRVTAPVLILHGARDSIIPIEFGRQQARNFATLRSFVELPDSGHNDWMLEDGDLARTKLVAYARAILARSQPE
jgi:pimeloyl-ACP methyl ester carboxylesterase